MGGVRWRGVAHRNATRGGETAHPPAAAEARARNASPTPLPAPTAQLPRVLLPRPSPPRTRAVLGVPVRGEARHVTSAVIAVVAAVGWQQHSLGLWHRLAPAVVLHEGVGRDLDALAVGVLHLSLEPFHERYVANLHAHADASITGRVCWRSVRRCRDARCGVPRCDDSAVPGAARTLRGTTSAAPLQPRPQDHTWLKHMPHQPRAPKPMITSSTPAADACRSGRRMDAGRGSTVACSHWKKRDRE